MRAGNALNFMVSGTFRTDTMRMERVVRTMWRRMKLSPFAIASMLCLAPQHGARAEPTSTDQRIQELAQKKPDSGLVFIEARLYERGKEAPAICQKIWVTATSSQADKAHSSRRMHRLSWVAHPTVRLTVGGPSSTKGHTS
jgi:hypothetical protein